MPQILDDMIMVLSPLFHRLSSSICYQLFRKTTSINKWVSVDEMSHCKRSADGSHPHWIPTTCRTSPYSELMKKMQHAFIDNLSLNHSLSFSLSLSFFKPSFHHLQCLPYIPFVLSLMKFMKK